MLRLAAVIPFALVGCVDTGDEGLYVLNNTAVTGTSCSLTGNPDSASTGHGIISVITDLPYIMTPLLQSRLAAPEEGVDEQSRTIQLRGADVTLTLKAMSIENINGSFTNTNPDSSLGDFSLLFSGSVPPGGSANAFVDIIPVSTIRDIGNMAGTEYRSFNAEVLASVVVKGEVNGDSIEAQPYYYPVTVCDGCVVNITGACVDFAGTARTGNACNMFQDGVVDCCRGTDGFLHCPAVKETLPP
jgi:hypothetical protein